MALTDAGIRKLRGQKQRYEKHDKNGLYLVIQPSGAKSWALRYRRPNGKPAKLTLGPLDLSDQEPEGTPVIGAPLSLLSARALATEQSRQRARGVDIAAKHIADKRRKIQAIEDAADRTFPALARRFIDDYAKPKTRSWRDTARLLGLAYPPDGGIPTVIKNGLADRWRDRDVATLNDSDLYTVVDEARRTGVPGLKRRRDSVSDTMGRALAAALSRFFSWQVEHRQITVNPAVGMFKPDAPEARDRVLSPSELRWFWTGCEAVGNPFAPVLKLLLLTGCRRDEVADMTRAELSEDGTTWTIPGARTKNGREHVVHLSPLAREIIAAAPRIEGKPGFLFTTNGKTPLSGWSKCKTRLDAAMLVATKKADATIPPWRLHDIRRTVATVMHEDLDIDPHVVEAVLNHVSGAKAGIAGTYNKAKYAAERRAALNAWARYILLLLDADLFNAHRKHLAHGDDSDQEQVRENFRVSIREGGERWARYLAFVSGKPNVVR
ncbi:MAG TPA: integrase arm-type DNA-binding domain-containing protein, partial [Xanthobacteraceae bacterium]|nr:integrase arm-type DNA-binding domain-containing protein [Xanthobacteraceae bacterium]